MAKNKKSKILAMALCASVMTGIYAAPVMAGTVEEKTQNINANKTIAGETYFVGKVIADKFGTTTDGFYVDENGTLKSNQIKVHKGEFTVDRNGAVKAANGAFTVDKNGRVSTSRLNLSGVAMYADGDGNSLTVGSSTLSFDEANETITNTEAIRRVVNKDTGMSATYLEETVKAHSAFGLQVLDEDGKPVATISRNGTGEFNGPLTANKSLTALDVDSKAKSVLGVSGVQLYNSDGTNKVNITNSGASRFGSFDETNVRIEGGALKIMAPNNEPDAAVSGPLVAQLSEDGLTLVDADRKYSTLTAAQLANLNSTIKEGGVVDANELNVSGATGGLYVKDVINDDDVTGTMIYTKAADGKTNTMWIDPNTGNLSTVGTIGVGFANGLNKKPTTILDKTGDINVGISYNADGSVAGQKINLDAETGNITLADKATVDGVDVSALSENVGGISGNVDDLEYKTQNIDKNRTGNGYTTFNGALNTDGTIRAAGGAVELRGNWETDGTLKLRYTNSQYESLTATQLGNINNVILENGVVNGAAGSVIGDVRFSGGGDLNNVNHINGALIEAYDADPDNGVSGLRISGVAMENGAIKVNAINGAAVNYYGKDGLEIAGVGMLDGDVSAKSFNGVSIVDNGVGSAIIGNVDLSKLNGSVISATEDIAGINRENETTTIEKRLSVSEEELVIGGYGEGNSLTINADGARFAGNVVFNNGYNVSFSYGADGSKGTSLGKLAEGFDNLNAKVDDIYDRTQGIDRDENGNTVISNDERTWNEETGTSEVTGNDGATITVGDDVNVDGGNLNVNNGDLNVGAPGSGSGSGEGGNTGDSDGTGNGNFAGDVNVDGDANIDGSVTVGDATDGKYTQVGEGGMTVVGKDKNGNTTTNNISDKGMTITGKDDNSNTTTNNISDKGMTITGKDENGNTTTNNISDKGMTVTGGNGTTNISGGDISVDNSVTVGSGENQTVVNNDGVTVGGEEGTSIKNDSISVGDGGYIGDGDVRSGEGVSLNQTAERVGHLENRVGELEDRIDKVGAMAAAIANLRSMGYDPAAPTEVAVGIGQYRDETGAALGLFHYPNRDFMLSLSVSTSGDEVMGGIGATWKFGRKSPEKVAEIKKAQAEADARRAEEAKLAKAEEMKQAAKEAKIKAQQERHAKLAAERAAQAEAAK